MTREQETLVAMHAKALSGKADWDAYRVEVTEGGWRVAGAVAPLFWQSANKGKRDWRKIVPGTGRVVDISREEQSDWEAMWGGCVTCGGSGRVVVGWFEGRGISVACRKCR